jgi:hypothetical protein
MLHSHMQLGNQPQKLTRDTTLLQNEKCIIKAAAGTLTLPILVDNTTCGQLFIGKGQLTLDAIIETTRGAIGKPLIRDLTPDHPFLMLSETKNLKENLAPATDQDLTSMGYKSTDEFLKTANETFDQFAHKRHSHIDIEPNAHIFAFANEHERWDFLIAKDDKLVYTSKHKVFVSKNNGESVSLGQGSILVAKKGKTVVIDRGNILVDRDEHY